MVAYFIGACFIGACFIGAWSIGVYLIGGWFIGTRFIHFAGNAVKGGKPDIPTVPAWAPVTSVRGSIWRFCPRYLLQARQGI